MSKDRSILVIGMAAIMLFSILGVTLLAVSSNSISGGENAAHIDNENIVTYDEEESLVEIPDTGIIVDSKEDEPSEPVISEPEITEPSVEEQIVEEQYEAEPEKEETSQTIENMQFEPGEIDTEPTSEPEITEPSVEEQIVEEQYEAEPEKEETSQTIEDTESEPGEIGTEPTSEQDAPAEDTAQQTDSGTITVNPLIDHEVEIEYELIEDLFD